MRLPFFTEKPIQKKTNYLGLLFRASGGIGMIIRQEQERFALVESVKFDFSNSWENISEDVDEVLFKLEGKTKLQLKDSIIFVYSHLIDPKTKEIKHPYLTKIKQLSRNLELRAMGYIECYEAVAKYLIERDQMPITANIIELDETDVSLFVYKGGKIVFSKTVASTNNIIDDLTSCFSEMTGTLLPSRIILYNSHDLDDESTKILTHRWSEEIFIQPPRVEIISEESLKHGLIKIFQEQVLAGEHENFVTEPVLPQQEKEVAGFAIGEDVAKRSREVVPESIKTEIKEPMGIPSLSPFWSKVKSKSQVIISKIKAVRIPLPVYGVVGIVFILIGLFLNEYFFHKATLTVFLPSEKIEKTLFITASQRGGDLTINVATHSASFSDSIATTGNREVGEKAKGEVTVHNFDSAQKTIAAGTAFTASELSFILDKDVNVASASEAVIQGNLVKQPGKSTGTLTASDIGSAGNLASGIRFKIDDLSTTLYFGINASSLSGGSKKEVQTVSKNDIDNLKTRIINQEKKTKTTQKGVGPNDKIIPALSQNVFSNLKFSHELGEEAQNVSLSANVLSTVYFYKDADLISFIQKATKSDVKPGFSIPVNKVNYSIDKIDNKGSSTKLTVKVKARAIKDVNKQDISAKTVGKDQKDLENILKKDLGVQGFELKINQPLPIFKNTLPLFPKNISLTISSI